MQIHIHVLTSFTDVQNIVCTANTAHRTEDAIDESDLGECQSTSGYLLYVPHSSSRGIITRDQLLSQQCWTPTTGANYPRSWSVGVVLLEYIQWGKGAEGRLKEEMVFKGEGYNIFV